jgi:hypothetical protein
MIQAVTIPSSAVVRVLPGVHLISAVIVTHHAKTMAIAEIVPKIWAFRGLAPSASASVTSSKKPLGRNPSHVPPKRPQARARDIATRESCVLLLGVTHLPPGLPAMDSSSSRNESMLGPLELKHTRS